MKMFVIILHYGNQKTTMECLGSVIENEKKYREIIVIDNDLKSRFKINDLRIKNKIKIILSEKNLGYAGGMNVGIRYALKNGADFILLLNNDVLFEDGIIELLVKFLREHKKAGIVGPAIKFKRENKLVFDLGGKVNGLTGRTSHDERREILSSRPKIVDYVSGCAMLIKKEVFGKIGFFDENYFLYYEDVDFCIRAKKEGFNTYVIPSVSIRHALSLSVGENSSLAIYHQTKSGLFFGKKHLGIKRFFNFLFILIQSLYLFIKDPIHGRYAFFATFDYLQGK